MWDPDDINKLTEAEVIALAKQKCSDRGYFMNRLVLRLVDIIERKQTMREYVARWVPKYLYPK